MSSTSVISSRRWGFSKQNDLWRRTEQIRTIIVVLAVLVVVWEMSVHLFSIRSFLLPAPSVVISDIIDNPLFFGKQSMYTLYVTSVGFLILASCVRASWNFASCAALSARPDAARLSPT